MLRPGSKLLHPRKAISAELTPAPRCVVPMSTYLPKVGKYLGGYLPGYPSQTTPDIPRYKRITELPERPSKSRPPGHLDFILLYIPKDTNDNNDNKNDNKK